VYILRHCNAFDACTVNTGQGIVTRLPTMPNPLRSVRQRSTSQLTRDHTQNNDYSTRDHPVNDVRSRRVVIRCLALTIALLTGCSAAYHMGDPITAKPHTQVGRTGPTPAAPDPGDATAEYRDKSAEKKAGEWEFKWNQIQSPSDSVTWTDHFQVCGLKYRFRNYDQLFRCLDLLEAKIAAGGERVPKAELVQRGAPVMIAWIRASAYAELGEPETALKWAELAWAALPEEFRAADSRITKTKRFGGHPAELKAIYYVGESLGSNGLGFETTAMQEGMFREGRDNPAALDFRPAMVTMSLAVQRALLNQRLGNADKTNAALADLRRWELVRWMNDTTFNIIPVQSKIKPFKGKAQLLSIGPLFVAGDYQRVIVIYEQLARKVASTRQRESAGKALGSAFFSGDFILKVVSHSDRRLFTVAVEDVSNALLYAQSLSRIGRIKDSSAMLDTLLELPEIRAMGNLYWVALYERALIAIKGDQSEDGIRLLTRSVEAIESVRSTISFEAAKIGFAGDKQTVYAALIGALAQHGDWQQAFLFAERAKARALVDLLAQRRDLGPPQSADEKVRELFANAAAVDSSVGLASEGAVRGIKLVADSRDALANVAPEAASLISVQKVGIAEIAARMSADESLVDYYVQGEDLYAFVMNGVSIKGVKLSARGLEEEVRSFRDAIDRRDGRAMETGRALHDRLIRPLLTDLTGRKLIIAPHGVLHYLPFAALWDGEEYLVDRFSLRLIPSASALVYLRTGQPKKLGKLLALGNPDLGLRSLDLPNAQVEAVTIAAMFPDSRALVRAEASKSAVKELANGFSMLHFATHGKFDANVPLSSGLYLAKGREADGILTVSDLYSLRWDVDLVTLSACETGLGKVAKGDDVIGLTRGFLYAGARSIVASLWEVDDAATAHLMESFYRNLSSNDKREALRLAQLETRQQYPEPWFWAAFNILGRAD
jgi:CHAT domain-containing protein